MIPVMGGTIKGWDRFKQPYAYSQMGSTFSFLNAFSLDGINDYLDSAGTTVFAGLRRLSIATWVKINAETVGANKGIVVYRKDDGLNTGIGFVLVVKKDTGNLYYTVRINNNLGTAPGGYVSIPDDGDWHLVIFEFDGFLSGDANRLKIWVDDVQKTVTFDFPGVVSQISATLGSIPIRFGANLTTTGYLGGLIDHVAIKHGTWSAEEKTAIYATGVGAEYPSYDSHWNANSNTTDLGANGLNLTLRNGATYAAH